MKITMRLILVISGFLTLGVNVAQTSDSADKEVYKFKIIKSLPVTPVKDQYKSGTCWSFAATSYFESELMRLGYDTTDISEMYFVYQAYQEKARQYVRNHGNANFGPGGQAHDVLNVIRKHGFTSENEYPGLLKGESKHIHGELDAVLKGYLDALIANKDGKLSQVWFDGYKAILDTYLGPDPAEPKPVASLKPGTDAQYSKFNSEDYIEITSYTHHPFYEAIALEIPDNWSHDLYYNIPVDDLISVINNAINTGYTVCWDGDVSDKGFSHSNGVAIIPVKDMANMEGSERSRWEKLSERERNAELYTFEKPGTEKIITQEMRQEAFDNFQATDDHLMHFTGMVTDQHGTVYYTTKNSWAAGSNKTGGFLNISESYVRLNTIAIMVHKDAVPSSIRKKLKL